jgi:hypothetical protein
MKTVRGSLSSPQSYQCSIESYLTAESRSARESVGVAVFCGREKECSAGSGTTFCAHYFLTDRVLPGPMASRCVPHLVNLRRAIGPRRENGYQISKEEDGCDKGENGEASEARPYHNSKVGERKKEAVTRNRTVCRSV